MNAPTSFKPITPVAGAATAVSYSNDFDARRGFPEDYEVWKPPKYNPTCAEFVSRILFGVLSDPLDRAIKLIEEHFRSPQAALSVPVDGCFSFLQGGRVNSNG